MPWRFSPVPVLARLHMPELWVLAGDDSVAPGEPTIRRLQDLQGRDPAIQIVLFPHTDHGIRTYVGQVDGSRATGGMASGCPRLLGDWAKGSLEPPYGAAQSTTLR